MIKWCNIPIYRKRWYDLLQSRQWWFTRPSLTCSDWIRISWWTTEWWASRDNSIRWIHHRTFRKLHRQLTLQNSERRWRTLLSISSLVIWRPLMQMSMFSSEILQRKYRWWWPCFLIQAATGFNPRTVKQIMKRTIPPTSTAYTAQWVIYTFPLKNWPTSRVQCSWS